MVRARIGKSRRCRHPARRDPEPGRPDRRRRTVGTRLATESANGMLRGDERGGELPERSKRRHLMDFTRISRRRLLQGAATVGAVGPLATLLPRRAFAKDLTIGFIYVGPRDDFGYNQAHAVGAAAVKKMAGVKVAEEENVPETLAVTKTMESMINLDGATLLFPTSFGYYNPYMVKAAAQYKDVRFEHCGGLWNDTDPKNAGSYFGYIDEACHLSGIVAGYSTKTGKLGYVAAKPIPQVLRNINAFTLGAKLANPNATTQVIFTGDWSLPIKEAEATNSLISQGVDVVSCHVDSPKVVVETAERRGIMTCGYHASQASLAPKGYLTGAEWNWEELYPSLVTKTMKGEPIPNLLRGGLKEKIVKQGAYASIVSEKARKHADEVKAKFMDGSYVIFKGPIKDNKGNMVIAAGAAQGQTDITLEKMNYLIDGVLGATS
jgi:basic membrane protein A and related proteins